MNDTTLSQRIFWSSIYLGFITVTLLMVVSLWENFSAHPTVTTMVSSTYPVEKVPFPAVAVCSVNKISRKRAQHLAFLIANFTKRDPEEIMHFMRFVGQLHDFDFHISSLPSLLEFQQILDMLQIDMTDLAKNLAIPCEELMNKCLWRGVEVDCRNFFFLRRTHHGYCCIFNYIRISRDVAQPIAEKPLTTHAGLENGLYVSVNNQVRDYYYTLLSSVGVMVQIFLSSSYPEKISGELTEIFTQPNSENFIEIKPITLTSVPEVADFHFEKRGCLFDDERETPLQDSYAQSDCHVECLVKSIQAMCDCVPFMIPLSDNESVCTLADIPCLSRYIDKWSSHFPEGDTSKHLKKEKHDSLRCNTKCYPPCEGTVYDAFANSFPIFNKTERQQNITRIYVYFLDRFTELYQQDVVYYWFEMLSNFGGIFGIFVGWSLISMVRLVQHYLMSLIRKLRFASKT